jgi:hypothetical protein
MRTSRPLVVVILFLSCFALYSVRGIIAQQVSSSAQAATLLQQSLSSQTGGVPTNDVTLTGTISFPHSAQTGSFPVTLTVLANGTTRMVTSLPAGAVTHIWSLASGDPTVTTTGPTGTTQSQASGNNTLMPTAAWFSPVVLTNLFSGSSYSVSDAGSATKNGATVNHLIATQSAVGSQSPTETDIYLDPTSGLPAAVTFQVNPYNAPGTSKPATPHTSVVPEEVRFSDYQSVQGWMLPFHIQTYLGTQSLQIIDVAVSSAVVNSGATIPVPGITAN